MSNENNDNHTSSPKYKMSSSNSNNRDAVTSAIDQLSINSPKESNSPPISSSHGQLSSDIQARIKAFQQNRINKPPPSNANSPPINNFSSMSAPNLDQTVGQSLQSPQHSAHTSPSAQHPDYSQRSLSQSDAAAKDLIPSPLPNSPRQQSYQFPSGATTPTNPTNPINRLPFSPDKAQAFDLSKKPSLSQRRGMKISMPDLNLNQSPQQDSNSGNDDIATSGLNRKLSERRKPKNLSLNLSDLTGNNSGNTSDISSVSSSSNSSQTNLHSKPLPNSNQSNSADSKKQQLHGLFANYSKYVDIKSGSLNFAGKASLHSKGVDFSSGSSFRISLDELEFLDEIGHGNYGTVSKVLHKPTGVTMAMKEVRLELDENKFTQILMELEILHKCDSPYIVDFYGAFFVEGAVYMCMEHMDGGSLDKIYTKDVGVTNEPCLAYITECVIRGLKELKDTHNIIHRDVKPTNILINTLGKVKLCDFGVSGNLVASLAKTNIGCQSYMAPERIKSVNPDDSTYSIQSDIWSLGLTILEIAAGHYPYPAETYDNIFSQLSAIVDGDPPKLDSKRFSKEAQLFVKSCLNKNPDLRPSYDTLLNHPWLIKYRNVDPKMSEIVTEKVKELQEEKEKKLSRSNSHKKQPNLSNVKKGTIPLAGANPNARENVHTLLKNKVNAPALHRGGLPQQNRRFR